MSNNLTDKQKRILRWLVDNVREGILPDQFNIVWEFGGSGIIGFKGDTKNIPEITPLSLNALQNEGYLIGTAHYISTFSGGKTETNRQCALTQKAFDAVDNNFLNSPQAPQPMTIGAIVMSMSGGNLQAIGAAQDAPISQIINDPEMLHSQVDALLHNIVEQVVGEISLEFRATYLQAAQDLRSEILSEKPDRSVVQKSVRLLGFLGDIEGTIGLMTRVWSFLHPLLLILSNRFPEF